MSNAYVDPWDMLINFCFHVYAQKWHMTRSQINVPYQKISVPKITKQTKSHSLNFNVLSSLIDSSGDEV